MTRLRMLFLSAMVGFLAACVTPPAEQELAKAYANLGPWPSGYQSVIEEYLAGVLKDPYSARYEDTRLLGEGWYKTVSRLYVGYVVCSQINAKNSFGAYTGRKLHYFLVDDGRVIYHIGGNKKDQQSRAYQGCTSAGY